MQIPQILGIVAGTLSFISFIPYIISIFKGETKPQRATYIIWTLVTILTFSSYLSVGATFTIYVVFSCMIMQLLIFILSFKYGMGGLGRLDIACLLLALVAAVTWAITKNPELALYAGVFLEFIGFIPVFKKSYFMPKTENLLSWSIAAFAAFLNALAITNFKFSIAFYPILILISDAAVVFLLIIRPLFKNDKI